MTLLRAFIAVLVVITTKPGIVSAVDPVSNKAAAESFEFSRWPYHMDHARGFTAIINQEQDRLHLYDSIGGLVLAMRPAEGAKLSGVQLPRTGGYVLVDEVVGEGSGYFTLIDYDGKAVSERLLIKGGLLASPGGQFLYTSQGEYAAAPTVYDWHGHVLMNSRTSNFWLMTAVDDSELVFVNGQSVQVYSVPGMTRIREATFPTADFGTALPSTAVADADAAQFAFVSELGVVICDMQTSSIQIMPCPKEAGDCRLAWAEDGRTLLLFGVGEVPVISIFERRDAGYTVIESGFEIELDTPVQTVVPDPICFDHLCAVNYYFTTERGMEHRGYVFQWDAGGIRGEETYVIQGMVTSVKSPDPLSLTVLRLNNPISGSIMIESWSPKD